MKRTQIIRAFLIVFGISVFTVSYGQSHRGGGGHGSHGGHGETTPVKLGSMLFNFGIGVGAQYKGDYYGTGFGTKAAAEWGLWQAGPGVITLGAEAGASFSSGGYYGYNNYNARTVIIGGRAAWHYGWDVPGLDTYGGVSAGLGFHHYEYTNHNHNEVIPVPGVFVGASYFVTPKFGFNAEAGYDITNIQAGLIFKIH